MIFSNKEFKHVALANVFDQHFSCFSANFIILFSFEKFKHFRHDILCSWTKSSIAPFSAYFSLMRSLETEICVFVVYF